MKEINMTPAFILAFWIGFVCAISFMEAWLKFRAPGVTLTIGLSIGMKVFAALNKVEWVLMTVTFGWMGLSYKSINYWSKIGMITCALILFTQSFILLPDLTSRAISLIENNPLPPNSSTHIAYVVVELIKVALLVTIATNWFKSAIQKAKASAEEIRSVKKENYKKVAI